MPLLMEIVDALVEKGLGGRREIMAEVNRLAKELDVEPEVAALILGREAGIDISSFYEEVDRLILEKVKGCIS